MFNNVEKTIINKIYQSLIELGTEYTGTLKQTKNNTLILLDDKFEISVIISNEKSNEMVHAHVITKYLEEPDVKLDSCVIGLGKSKTLAVNELIENWMSFVVPPVFSFLLGKPVLDADQFFGNEKWGVKNTHGFIGDISCRTDSKKLEPSIFENVELFKDAHELAPACSSHLAKVTLSYQDGYWTRNLEINGHDIHLKNYAWPFVNPESSFAIFVVYAVFHYFDNLEYVSFRKKLHNKIDAGIKAFIDTFKSVSKPNLNKSFELLTKKGFDEILVSKIISFVPSAFSRILFYDKKVIFPDKYVKILSDATYQKNIPLISDDVYARAIATAQKYMYAEEYKKPFEEIAYQSAEINIINDMLDSGKSIDNLKLQVNLIPEIDVSSKAMQIALKKYIKDTRNNNSNF